MPQKVCQKAILENAEILKPVPDCCKNHEMCKKVVHNYPHALEVVPEFYKTKKMCDKDFNTHSSTI